MEVFSPWPQLNQSATYLFHGSKHLYRLLYLILLAQTIYIDGESRQRWDQTQHKQFVKQLIHLLIVAFQD
ncbi:unnamed protein product [Cuscuta campestris]|uniref:Uncharacterized protein n=1 Tax=Cuscuta campestris TaxID=132261 RepID=A0A484MMK8_9ASTE|nr:unnamed protein product [Cuscuta campestris]